MPTIRLPYPPSVNQIWRSVRIGKFNRVLLSKAGRQYRADVKSAVQKQVGKLRPTNARLKVCILACMPDKRRRDLSNILKAIEDALTAAGVWNDDEQIDMLSVVRGPVNPRYGYVDVSIERLSDEPMVQRELALAEEAPF
jgi:crossover junction endodeoxyribonuclease RusA